MCNKTLLVANLLIAVFPTNVFAHTGEHHASWLSNLVHYIISPVHLLMTISAGIVLGLVIHGIRKYACVKRTAT
jgi:hydrogenase/urease accessory protein HupE